MWEIEVSDKLGSWGAAGRNFRPGIWRTDDQRIADAAARTVFGVKVREIPDDAGVGGEAFSTDAIPGGVLTKEDLAGKNNVTFPCPANCGIEPYKLELNLNKHMAHVHPDWTPDPEAVPDPPESPFDPDAAVEREV